MSWNGLQPLYKILILTHFLDGLRKEYISAPFNFQHLTHTRPQQLPPLEQASQQELADGFRTIRASQAPRRELFGIKAEDIQMPPPSAPLTLPSSSQSTPLGLPDAFEVPLLSAPLPSSSGMASISEKSASNQPQIIRKARSVESFSQPFVKPRSPKSSFSSPSPYSPVNPPPRTSSRQAVDRPHDLSRPAIESPTAPTFSLAEHKNIVGTASSNHVTPLNDADATSEAWPFGAAIVTTPEDPTRQNNPVTSGYNTDLDDVPEEAESYFQYRPPGRTRATSGSSSLRHSRSFPVAASPSAKSGSRSCSKTNSLASKAPLEYIEGSTSSARSWRSRPSTSHSRYNDPFAVVSETLDSSWEDVIDYCYDHAAEADCDFDWDRASTIEAADTDDGLWMPKRTLSIRKRPSQRRPTATTTTSSSSSMTPPRTTTKVDRPQIIVPDVSSVPELASTSASSLGTSSTVPTPSDHRVAPDSFRIPIPCEEENQPDEESGLPSPSTLPSKPHLYEEGLIDDIASDPETGIYRPRFNEGFDNLSSGPESIRSRLSKCSSEESFNRPAALMRISSSSMGSLPDLVYSRRSLRHHVPTNDVIEEGSPVMSPVDEYALPDVDAERDIPTRPRSSIDLVRSSRFSQSRAPSIRATSPAAFKANARRALSASRGETPTPTPPTEPPPQLDAGTKDLLQIGRPRKSDRTFSLFPATRPATTNPVY